MSKDLFDFGFTAVEEGEIRNNKADRLYEAIQPLLENLKSNPEREYIHWPDRMKRVNEFQKLLKSIYEE